MNTFGGSFQNSTALAAGGISVPLTNFSKLVGTCEFWARPTSYTGSNGLFVNRNDSTPNASDWWWAGPYGSGTMFYFRLGNSSSCCSNDNAISSWSSTHPLNTWGFYSMTWNSGVESKVYFNGTLRQTVAISAIPNSNPSSNGRWGLGHVNSDALFVGQLSTFKHYNRVLSAAEVLQNFQADRPRFGR